MHTRYWTGFLLLVRCALYIVFSYNSLGHATWSLHSINVTFAAIFAWPWFTVKIYTKSLTNSIEGLVYLNLIILSTTSLAGVHSPALVNSLIGMVFAIMIGIIIYHFHTLYIAKSAVWLKILAKLTLFTRAVGNRLATEATPLLRPAQPPVVNRPVVAQHETLHTGN